MWTRNLRNEQGSSLVELALTLPLLLIILIGSAELGRIAYASIEVTNAARAAVAFGSQNLGTASSPGGLTAMKTAAALDASDLTSMGATLITVPTYSCACDTGSGAPAATACDGSACTGTIAHYVQATTSATVNTMFHYPGIPTSFTLHGYAEMRVIED
ncbi:MAG: TadE/TadG family type IV pilus assembly protein [Acidobacteriaceae bacterium]